MGKAGLIGLLVIAGVALVLADANASPGPNPEPPPTPGAPQVTMRPGNMGNIGNTTTGVNLYLPAGAFWTGGLNGSSPVTMFQSGTLTWVDSGGAKRVSYFTLS